MPNDLQELLNTAKDLLKNELTEIAFNTWIVPLNIESRIGNEIILSVENEFFRDTIMSKHLPLIRNTFNFITKLDCTVSIIVKGDSPVINEPDFTPQPFSFTQNREYQKNITPNCLNPKYTFETFVVGNNNRFAHAASLAVGDSPSNSYNPLFLYGGVGLGKTHLAQAIGNDILTRYPDSRVLYVPSEKFIQQYVDAYAQDRRNDFINFYQNIDTLIIDDVQFFSGKKGSQEVFFHIFNHLHQNGKQLVLTADRTPVDMRDITDRLLSRFKWGLTVKLDVPDFEHRLRILEEKLRREDINDIPHDVVAYIAKTVNTNVRELEGVVNSLIMHSTIVRRDITLELAVEVVSQFIKTSRRELTLDYIKSVVCETMGVEPALLESSSRRGEIVRARQVAMYFAKTLTQNYSLQQIGSYIAGRDHSTVIHSCKTISNLIDTDKKFKMRIDEIKLKLLSA